MAVGEQISRRNPTKLREILTAGSVACCRQGDKVALHIYTTEGEVLVHLSERAFVRSFRGTRDANGLPFRTLDELNAVKERAPDGTIIETPAVAAYGSGVAKYRAMLAERAAGSTETFRQLCKKHGCNVGSFYVWHSRQKTFPAVAVATSSATPSAS